jgi:GNAT superfamily N-acetyltransferase
MADLARLDNPIWHALTSVHVPLARAAGAAARYPAAVSPLAGLARPSRDALADLSRLTEPGETVGLITATPLDVPDGWQVLLARSIDQMICDPPAASRGPAPPAPFSALQPPDVPDMLALTAATEPGPFLARTIEMGRYRGIRAPDGRLVAMAGERLRLAGFTEISAVCTDPAFRGRGYARGLVASLTAQLVEEGQMPFLHLKTENRARRVYEGVGFRLRRAMQFTVLARR